MPSRSEAARAGAPSGAPAGPNVTAIPAELRELEHWLVWRTEMRDGRRTKVPYDPKRPQLHARSTDPATWAPFEVAARVATEHGFDGVGVALEGSGLIAFDIDGCVIDGVMHPAAAELVEQLDAYTETSPSGRGLRVIGRGGLHSERHSTRETPWGDEFAVFDRGKYMTITGDALAGHGELRDLDPVALAAVVAKYLPASASRTPASSNGRTPAAEEIVRRALEAANGEKFRTLFVEGDTSGYASSSEADMALAMLLAFWTSDPELIDQLFRHSALMREKWERTDYRERTIARALELTDVRATPGRHRDDDLGAGDGDRDGDRRDEDGH